MREQNFCTNRVAALACRFAATLADRVGIVNQGEVSATTTSSLALARNPNRVYLALQNKDASSTILVKFGASTASGSTDGINLLPGIIFESNIMDSVYIRSSSGAPKIEIMEGVN